MINKMYKMGLLSLSIILPVTVFAEELGQTKNLLRSMLDIVTSILIPLVFTLSLLLFFWGVAKYIWSAGDKEEGKKIMVWGIIALFVMSSVWAIVAFIQQEIWGDIGPVTMPIPTVGEPR